MEAAPNRKSPIENRKLNGGGGGIRTHEGLRPAGFQDRSHQPLDHPSELAAGLFSHQAGSGQDEIRAVSAGPARTWMLAKRRSRIFQSIARRSGRSTKSLDTLKCSCEHIA